MRGWQAEEEATTIHSCVCGFWQMFAMRPFPPILSVLGTKGNTTTTATATTTTTATTRTRHWQEDEQQLHTHKGRKEACICACVRALVPFSPDGEERERERCDGPGGCLPFLFKPDRSSSQSRLPPPPPQEAVVRLNHRRHGENKATTTTCVRRTSVSGSPLAWASASSTGPS